MAKESWIVKANKKPKFRGARVQPLQALWAQPGVHPQVRRLPHLLS